MSSLDSLLERFRAGKIAALSRAVSIVENRTDDFEPLLAGLHPDIGRARRIGITGPPGAGKSTLTDTLVARYRAREQTVAVIAVDPTSPFTGGALLGDRIRMEQAAGDQGVFVRSMATRGATGGLAVTTLEVCDVLDAFGFDVIIVETVGVGQSELAVAASTDATVLVLVPESGDAVQVLKAGVMEIGDVFVVNKSDRPQADRIAKDLEEMLAIRLDAHPDTLPAHVVKTVANQGTGVEELVDAIDARFNALSESGQLDTRRRAQRAEHVRSVVDNLALERLWAQPSLAGKVDQAVDGVANGRMSAYQAARTLLDTEG